MQDSHSSTRNQRSAVDNLLLLLAMLLMLLLCFTVVGIIPVVILVAGFALAIRSGNIANVRVTTRFLQIPLFLLAVALAWHAVDNDMTFGIMSGAEEASIYSEPDDIERELNREFVKTLFAPFIPLIGAALMSILWLQPITRQFDNLIQVFTRKSASDKNERPIISRDKMAAFSIADELKKWNDLRKEGLVSEQEFNEVRDRLLGSP